MAQPTQDDQDDSLAQLENDEAQGVYDWLSSFGSTGAMTVRLNRISPKSWKGVQTSGAIGKYEEPITDEDIQQEHGGGKYRITVEMMKKNKHGKPHWGYAGSRTFEIAGAPKISGLVPLDDDDDDDRKGNGSRGDGAVGQALNMAHNLAQARERELHELRQNMQNVGMDRDLIETIINPLRDELSHLRERLAEKDTALLQTLNKPVDNSSQERLFNIMENKEQAHGNNLEAVRQQYEQRIAKLQDYHHEEMKRYEDRFEREIVSVRGMAEREIASLKLSHQSAMDSQRQGYEMRIDGLRDIQKRLEREVAKAEAEAGELRGKKEQSPIDQIQGLVNLKQGFEALMPNGPEEKSGWERALDLVANSPLAEGIAGRIAGGIQGAQGQEPEAPQTVPVQLPDGRVVQVPPQVVQRMRAQQEAKQKRREELGADIPEISESDMAKAVAFMEAAIRNGTDPAMFAASARNMLPEDIMTALKAVGVDAFLAKVAKIQTGSPLASIAGRTWVRQVAEYLLGGEVASDENTSEDDIDEISDDEAEGSEDSPVESP